MKIFLIISLMILGVYAKELNKVHKVVVLKNWKPYYFLDDKGKPSGYSIDLFEKIANNIGLNYQYVIVDSWKDAHKLIESNKAQIVPNIGIDKMREDIFSFTEPTDFFEIGLFKRGELNIKDKQPIKDLAVGVVLKNICEKLITDETTNYKVTYQSFYKSIAALRNKEIDLLCYPKPLMQNVIKELNLENITPYGNSIDEVPRGIGVSKNEIHLLELFEDQLLKMRSNGEFDKIYAKWFIQHQDIELSYEQLLLIVLLILFLIIFILFYINQKKLIITQKELELIIKKKTKELEILQDEQLKQQKILLTQSKVAAIGEMLGNIAHQWRQPLNIITTNVTSLMVSIDFGDKISEEMIKECGDGVVKQSLYLSKTIDDFREFFKSDEETKKIYNLKNIIYKLKDLVINSYENNYIECIIDIKDEIDVELNENLLIQALINICNNAKDAFKESDTKTGDKYLFLSISKDSDDAIITFKDTAGGIKDEAIEKVFEPYFTTKNKSVGTGIGLYMTHGIITKHLNGTIEVSNERFEYKGREYKGASFKIKIPVKKM